MLADASESLVEDDSAWLVAPVADRIDSVREEIDGLLSGTRTARTAVDLAPSMLGRDEPRTYFVAFTTPAESRGLGGFMGTWAELRADDGRLDVTRTGQTIGADERDGPRSGAQRPGGLPRPLRPLRRRRER